MSTLSQYYFQRVLVNSDDQSGEKDHGNFIVRFAEPLHGKYKVHYITIPNTLTTVVVSINNQLEVGTASGGPYTTVTIPEGYYNFTTLATALATALDAAFPGPRVPHTLAVDVQNRLVLTTADASATYFDNLGNLNRTLGLFETIETTVASGSTFPVSMFLGDPLSIGIEIKEASDAGYVTAGGAYVNDTKVTPSSTPILNTPEAAVVNGQFLQSSKQQATLLAPLVAGYNSFNFTSQDDFEQFIKLEKGTKTLSIRTVFPVTGALAPLRGPWEMLIERVESDLTKPKLKRQRRVFETQVYV
jgi:hypothetical protein